MSFLSVYISYILRIVSGYISTSTVLTLKNYKSLTKENTFLNEEFIVLIYYVLGSYRLKAKPRRTILNSQPLDSFR